MTVPDHLSYSSLSTYNQCPRRYYLGRVKKAEALPAWYFAIGTAVHQAIEWHLSGATVGEDEVETVFIKEVERLMLIEPDTSLWLHGGSKDEPITEERALKRAQECFETAVTILQDIDVYEVEPDITGYLPGCDLPIMAFPDLLGEHKKHGPMIVDWKSGASKPKDQLQLETYGALLKVRWFKINGNTLLAGNSSPVQYPKGAWAMLKPDLYKTGPLRVVSLKETPESMGKMFHAVEEKIQKKIWPTLSGFGCKFCEQLPNCKLKSGSNERTRYYDKSEEEGYPY
jgi:hypothetical protein